jgi:DNA-binding NarL/FixJ family response regulator
VKSHRTKIMEKLQVGNLTELIHFALKLRLIEPKF